MKRLIGVAAALSLGGCGLPPVVNLASFALDGMSLLSTGKSVSDHVLSAAAERDCAVWRVVNNEDVCREYDADKKSRVVLAEEKREHGTEIVGLTEADHHVIRRTDSKPAMLALVDPVVLPQFTSDGAGLGIDPPSGPIADPIGAVERAPNPDLFVLASADAPGFMLVGAIRRARKRTRPPTFKAAVADLHASAGELARAAAHKVSSARAPARVLVLGSFTRLDNAKRIARLWSGFRPAIVGARLGGETFHRVIIEAPGGDVDQRQRQLASFGQSVWVADVCAGGNSAEKIDRRCLMLPAVFGR